jgi:hypothetical protein
MSIFTSFTLLALSPPPTILVQTGEEKRTNDQKILQSRISELELALKEQQLSRGSVTIGDQQGDMGLSSIQAARVEFTGSLILQEYF